VTNAPSRTEGEFAHIQITARRRRWDQITECHARPAPSHESIPNKSGQPNIKGLRTTRQRLRPSCAKIYAGVITPRIPLPQQLTARVTAEEIVLWRSGPTPGDAIAISAAPVARVLQAEGGRGMLPAHAVSPHNPRAHKLQRAAQRPVNYRTDRAQGDVRFTTTQSLDLFIESRVLERRQMAAKQTVQFSVKPTNGSPERRPINPGVTFHCSRIPQTTPVVVFMVIG